MTIIVTPTEDGYHLRSDGLARRDRPELEMLGVPEAQIKNAGAVINQIANYAVNKANVGAGERIGIVSDNGILLARFQQGPTIEVGGLFGFRKRQAEVLRVTEPMDRMEYSKTLFSTIMLWRAGMHLESDDRAAAVKELRASIEFFPGEPNSDDEPELPAPYNWENHLAYAMLARLAAEPDEIEGYLSSALVRSRCFQRRELGDEAARLCELRRDPLVERARQLVIENCTEPHLQPVAPNGSVVMITSPIRTRAVNEDGTTVAVRKAAIIPSEFTAYYYFEDTPARLVEEAGVLEVAVDMIVENADRPERLLRLTNDIRDIYDERSEDAPVFQNDEPVPYRAGDTALSLAIAHVARLAFAGMSVAELRVCCELEDDTSALESARDKLDKLGKREHDAYTAAISA